MKQQGNGAGPKTADIIDDDEIEVLFKSGQLGTSTPDNILNTMWGNNTTHFGLRAVTEHYNRCWENIELKTDIHGMKYLELVYERQTKTRTGVDARNVKKLKPKMYTTGDERCPVATYKLYARYRPPHLCNDNDKFYLQANSAFHKTGLW